MIVIAKKIFAFVFSQIQHCRQNFRSRSKIVFSEYNANAIRKFAFFLRRLLNVVFNIGGIVVKLITFISNFLSGYSIEIKGHARRDV